MKRIFLVTLLILILLFANTFGVYADTVDPFDYARTLYEYILENFFGDIDENLLSENLIKAIAQTLDEYSIFMTVEEAEAYLNSVSGEFDGIGITYFVTEDIPQIVSVLRGSPAQKAGLIPGDRIQSINGKSTNRLNNEEIKSLIEGSVGEELTFLIKREGVEEWIEFVIVKETIIINPVSYRLISKDVGYIEISTFTGNTFDETKKACDFFKKRGIQKLILDLRNNGGGLVNQAVMVAGLFVLEGDITKLDFKNPDYPDMTFVSTLQEIDFRIKVLINENTGSAAELLAAAIKERQSGELIGIRTFGKGVFQTGQYIASYDAFKELFNQSGVEAVTASQLNSLGIVLTPEDRGGYVHITAGRYLTPLGNDINGIGLDPDTVINIDDGKEMINIYRTSDYFNYEAGSNEMILINAKAILSALGYYEGDMGVLITEDFSDALTRFQNDQGIVASGELNYITKRILDHLFEELVLEKDKQLKEAMNQLD